jgi:hypothetical protein
LAGPCGAIKAVRKPYGVIARCMPVPSTAIRRISYDDASRTLFVTFIDGDTYAYFEVAPKLYDDFRAATSKGRFFAYKVRDRYRYQRLGDPDDAAEPSPSPRGGPASPPPAAAGR